VLRLKEVKHCTQNREAQGLERQIKTREHEVDVIEKRMDFFLLQSADASRLYPSRPNQKALRKPVVKRSQTKEQGISRLENNSGCYTCEVF
jgi:hypothetical protein